jgi:hypothetical protein
MADQFISRRAGATFTACTRITAALSLLQGYGPPGMAGYGYGGQGAQYGYQAAGYGMAPANYGYGYGPQAAGGYQGARHTLVSHPLTANQILSNQ